MPREQGSIYLKSRALLSQVQLSHAKAILLIQAALLLDVYEYTHGRPDDAFITITTVVRMVYAAGIPVGVYRRMETSQSVEPPTNTALLLEAGEASNTWWAINGAHAISDNSITFSEVSVPDQPLLTVFPDGNVRLPTEQQLLDQLDVLTQNLYRIFLCPV
ncbi:hypothetical protein BT63DRAFT_461300 [Microthyrium microscopicum]|uniref:Transcription factor domain-containing protein n=1 Tax=Microthyrium microscopicum TaxID=703497 RepID=A0A6A6TX78_9PEZI|nr:hypothetical protein BT63DRAFT_461300 [Microthyrium microscopicum]